MISHSDGTIIVVGAKDLQDSIWDGALVTMMVASSVTVLYGQWVLIVETGRMILVVLHELCIVVKAVLVGTTIVIVVVAGVYVGQAFTEVACELVGFRSEGASGTVGCSLNVGGSTFVNNS